MRSTRGSRSSIQTFNNWSKSERARFASCTSIANSAASSSGIRSVALVGQIHSRGVQLRHAVQFGRKRVRSCRQGGSERASQRRQGSESLGRETLVSGDVVTRGTVHETLAIILSRVRKTAGLSRLR